MNYITRSAVLFILFFMMSGSRPIIQHPCTQHTLLDHIRYSIRKGKYTGCACSFRADDIYLTIGMIWWLLSRTHTARMKREKDKLAQLEREAGWRQEVITMEQRINESKLRVLQAQMNPHFIFNVLGSIRRYIRQESVERSEQLLLDLGGLIRKSMDISGQQYISIRQEIDYLREYIGVEQACAVRQFTSVLDIDLEPEQLDGLFLPGMLLQPVIENAILHGLSTKDGGPALLEVFIRLSAANMLECTVRDNGPGIRGYKIVGAHEPIAIKNITQRLFLYNQHFAGQGDIHISGINESGDWVSGTQVIIHIPCMQAWVS